MIFTRIQRGAERTTILLRNKLETFAQNPVKNTFVFTRKAALNLLVARIVTLPIPIHASAVPTDLVNPEDAEPSAVVPLKTAGQATLTVTLSDASQTGGASLLVPQANSLTTIAVGQSYYDQEIAAREAEAARIAAEQAAAAEIARKAQLTAQQVAKEAKIAVQRASVAKLSPSDARRIAYDMVVAAFGESEWSYFDSLITRESGWNPQAMNASSGACGLPQALPCRKLPNGINSTVEEQVQWTINYIKNRYGTPSEAVSFHNSRGWY